MSINEMGQRKEDDDDYAEDIDGHPAEIYVKFRHPRQTHRTDMLHFTKDKDLVEYLKNGKVYVEKYRDAEIAAVTELNKVIPNEDPEERMDRIDEANSKLQSLTKDPLNLAMGVGMSKREYKAQPIPSDEHKYFILVRNNLETFEAVPVDHVYEMVAISVNRFKNEDDGAIEDMKAKMFEKYTGRQVDDGTPEKTKKVKKIAEKVPERENESTALDNEDTDDVDDDNFEHAEIDYTDDDDEGSGSDKMVDEEDEDADEPTCRASKGNTASNEDDDDVYSDDVDL